jgi:hypothetical protein
MPKMKVWDGSAWITLDANNADKLGGQLPSFYAAATHTHSPGSIGAIANEGGLPSFAAGSTGIRPAAGTNGRLYLDTTEKKFYRDTGSAWELVGGSNNVNWADIVSRPTTFTPAEHVHNGADITSGIVVAERLPSATTGAVGAVQLSSSVISDSNTLAATASAVKAAYDAAVAAQTTANGKAATVHSHNDIYYTEAETNTLLAGKLAATGKAVDSNLLDGIDSASFLRSDVADDVNGKLNFNTANGRLIIPVGANKYAT